MLRHGFDGLGLHRIVGRLDARNTASARVLERLGMRREAHLRENEYVKGEWTDEAAAFAGVKILCAQCYDRAKRMNVG